MGVIIQIIGYIIMYFGVGYFIVNKQDDHVYTSIRFSITNKYFTNKRFKIIWLLFSLSFLVIAIQIFYVQK